MYDINPRPDEWQRRFDEFVSKRTRTAVHARLPPYVSGTHTAIEDALIIGSDWTHRLFDGPFFVSTPLPSRPSCSLVFVQSADGNTGAKDPAALGGGATDKHLIYEGLSRVAADGVLAGAETMRSGNIVLSVWHPELVALRLALGKPRHPIQIVATLRGVDVTQGLIYNVPDLPVILVTVSAAAERMRPALEERPWIRTLVMNSATGLAPAFEDLRARGVHVVSCIGGRTLARGLLDADLVDDVYLTTAPARGGEPNTRIESARWSGAIVLRKHGTGVEQGVIFDHVRRAAGPPYFPVAHV